MAQHIPLSDPVNILFLASLLACAAFFYFRYAIAYYLALRSSLSIYVAFKVAMLWPLELVGNLCRWLFEAIHYQHYKQEWNGKKRLKTVKITGLRRALVDDVGQRKIVVFYWKIGKYYI
jgi:hypothetical protein